MKRTKKVLNFFSSQIQSVNNGLKDAINAGKKNLENAQEYIHMYMYRNWVFWGFFWYQDYFSM